MVEEGDEIRIGPIRIPVVADDDPRRLVYNAAGRIAQAATTLADLLALVRSHPDPLVRAQAVPRLRARFPAEPAVFDALVAATRDADDHVRYVAYSGIADLDVAGVAEALVPGLSDTDADVRYGAATALLVLGDPRAPDDPEAWAYGTGRP